MAQKVMDTNTMNTMGTTGGKKPVGPVIGLIIILIIIIVGGIYFWMTRTSYAPQNGNNPQNQGEIPNTEAIRSQSGSDETGSIETDLNSFNQADINGLDSDLQ